MISNSIKNADLNDSSLKPAFSEESVPIVFAANAGFVPVFSVCLKSLLEHCSQTRNYDIVLLHTNVREAQCSRLLSMTENMPHVSLRFCDVSPIVKGRHLKANAHISVETYFRFFIQEVLPDYEKVLYLDCDMLVNCDPAELYDTDVNGVLLAAARDADFLGQIHGGKPSTLRYCQKAFPMKNPDAYFQAGVLLLNEAELRKSFSLEDWLRMAAHPYMYNDQDVLNLACEGRVKYLDMAYNMLADSEHLRIQKIISFAPESIQKEYFKARENPKLIHYAGRGKPWHDKDEDFADAFWAVAERTPFHENLLAGLKTFEEKEAAEKAAAATPKGMLKKAGKLLGRGLLDLFFPLGTERREWLKHL